MTERKCFRLVEKIAGKKRKKVREDRRRVYEASVKERVFQIDDPQVSPTRLSEHLLSERDPLFYEARCLVLLKTGKRSEKGNNILIEVPRQWQFLAGGERIELTQKGLEAWEEARDRYMQVDNVIDEV